jgi:hypothetical protein
MTAYSAILPLLRVADGKPELPIDSIPDAPQYRTYTSATGEKRMTAVKKTFITIPALLALLSATAVFAGQKANDAVTITSLPDGAQIEWNRKIIGTTPLTFKVGEYAFNAKKSSLLSKHLAAPIVVVISKEGYVTRQVTITGEPLIWRSYDRRNAYRYWIIPSNTVHIDLDKISAVHAALTNADVLKLKATGFGDDLIIDKIKSNPAAFRLELDDLATLHNAGISDAIIQAMLHAK